MNLTLEERTNIFDKVCRLVETKHFDPSMNGVDWNALAKNRRDQILASEEPETFEKEVQSLVADLKTSHTGFRHTGMRNIPARNAINATMQRIAVNGSERWMFQDVHPGGPAYSAGMRPGDLLLGSRERDIRPPEGLTFSVGESASLLIEKLHGGQQTVKVQLTGELKTEKTFREVSEQFLRECEIMTRGERSEQYVKGQYLRSSVHLVPFFGNMDISKITTGKIVEYRIHRHQQAIAKRGKPPAHSTMHHEIVTLRQTLKTALCHGWLDRLPDFSEPYRRSSKISYRAWFSPEEYEKLCEATRKRALEPKKKGFKWEAEQLHDFVLFAGNTGLRPDEARRLEFRDVEIVDDEPSGETILEIEVRGKRGFGYCKSMPDAVSPFERLRSRLRPRRVEGVRAPIEVSDNSDVRGEEWRMPEPTDLIFPKWQSELFKTITEEENLRFDRDGRPRTAYSLRHTYISMRLMEGANIYQIAKNCRTSVGMIEKYYGVHIKNSLNAAAINVVRSGKDVMAEEFE